MVRRSILAGVACVVGLLVACTGDNPDLETHGPGADASTADASAVPDGSSSSSSSGGGDGAPPGEGGAGCEPIPGDLLTNGSFERASTTDKLSARHDFDLGMTASQGAQFEIGASIKTLDGNAEPVVVELRVVSGTYNATKTARLNADGTWTRVAIVLPLPQDGSKLSMELSTEQPRSLGYDRVFVRRVP